MRGESRLETVRVKWGFEGLGAALALAAGVGGAYWESSLLVGAAMLVALVLVGRFLLDARPHNHWRGYRRRRGDDP
jgi:hypothetical protein